MQYRICYLGNKSAAEIIELFSKIPENRSVLILNGAGLYKKTGKELAESFPKIPPQINVLNLSVNCFNQQTAENLSESLKALPPHIIKLILNKNELYQHSADDLAQILSSISEGVRTLVLQENGFDNKTGDELAIIIAAISEKVVFLDLSGNFLGRLPKDQLNLADKLKNMFTALRENITSLDLSSNQLDKIPVEILQDLRGCAPHVQNLHLSEYEIKQMSLEQRHALGAIFPNIREVFALEFTTGHPKSRTLTEFGIVRSLFTSCAFFVRDQFKMEKKEIDTVSSLSEDVKEFIKSL